MKRLLPLIAATFLFAGCGTSEEPAATPTSRTPPQTSISTLSSIPTSTSTVSPTPSTSGVAHNSSTPATEPTLVECLEGTPGPARYSDGTIRSTDYCVDRYAAQLPEDSIFTAPGRGYQCPGTDAYVKDPASCTPENLGGDPSYQDLSQIPVAEGGTCPAAICGYGTDANGNPHPSSGELQALHGCEEGYITDPEHCAAIYERFGRQPY